MNMAFLEMLTENTLFRTSHASDYNAKEMSDLAFLYLVALHIMRCEYDTAPFAQAYARKTMSHNGFDRDDRQNTDLYQFLRVLRDHHSGMAQDLSNPKANELFWHEVHFNANTVKQLLNQMTRSSYDGATAKRLLLNLEQQLHITTSNYRSVRRLASEWDTGHIDTEQKKLTVTRLLQALRAKARRGDIIQQFQRLAHENHYELSDVCDPESGKGCHTTPQTSQKKPEMTFIKGLAIAAGIAAADHLLKKAAKT